MTHEPLLQVHDLSKHYGGRSLFGRGSLPVRAVDGVDLEVGSGETFGLVGESGCGKSTLGRCIARLEDPTAGRIIFEGADIAALPKAQLRQLRRNVQVVFQDPYASLNPRKTVGSILSEAFRIHGLHPRAQWRARVAELLETVGLQADHADRYPHEFSGGQRQRICIARALSLRPKLIIADEPVSALDVSVQAQVLNLMMSLQRSFGLSYLFISHDLRVVRHITQRLAIMYLGRIVEIGETRKIYQAPLHPYSKSLLSAVPQIDRRRNDGRMILRGELPSPSNPPSGCTFHPRCPRRGPECDTRIPLLREMAPGRHVACHYPLDAAVGAAPTKNNLEKTP